LKRYFKKIFIRYNIIKREVIMIEMKVMGIALDTRTGSPIVVLHDKENRRALPIWIGSAEASSIIRKIENLSVTRPMTHDLVISIIEKTGYKVSKVEINDVEKETYFATIFLEDKDGNEIEIDSRPSDAIAIAIRIDAPILVTANVLSNGSVSTDSAKDAQEAEEFKNFVQSIKPSDFAKLMKDNDHHESDQ
jgi:hypothetical protein